MVSLDLHNEIFLTTFKLTSSLTQFTVNYDLTVSFTDKKIGLLHANNKLSGSPYQYIINTMKYIYDLYYQNDDGLLLLTILQYILKEQEYQLALYILNNSDIIINNCTSNGGSNPIRQYLFDKIPI